VAAWLRKSFEILTSPRQPPNVRPRTKLWRRVKTRTNSPKISGAGAAELAALPRRVMPKRRNIRFAAASYKDERRFAVRARPVTKPKKPTKNWWNVTVPAKYLLTVRCAQGGSR